MQRLETIQTNRRAQCNAAADTATNPRNAFHRDSSLFRRRTISPFHSALVFEFRFRHTSPILTVAINSHVDRPVLSSKHTTSDTVCLIFASQVLLVSDLSSLPARLSSSTTPSDSSLPVQFLIRRRARDERNRGSGAEGVESLHRRSSLSD